MNRAEGREGGITEVLRNSLQLAFERVYRFFLRCLVHHSVVRSSGVVKILFVGQAIMPKWLSIDP